MNMENLYLFWDFFKTANNELLGNKNTYLKAFLALIFITNFELVYPFLGISNESTSYIVFSIVSAFFVFIVISQVVLIEKKKQGGNGNLVHFVPTYLLYNLYYSLLFLFGLILLIVPGFYAFIFFSMAPLIAVLDDEADGNYFAQSRLLVKKNIKLVAVVVFSNLILECSALLLSPIQDPLLKGVATFLYSLPDAYLTLLMTLTTVKIYYYLTKLNSSSINLSSIKQGYQL